MAILKRTLTIVVGKHAVYLRFPGSAENQTVHRIATDNFHKDWIASDNKEFYGLYLKGINQFYPAFEANVQQEQDIIDKAMAARGAKLPKVWVKECDEKLQSLLKDLQRRDAPTRTVPTSPTHSQDTVVAADGKGNYNVPIPPTTTATSNRRSLFEFGMHIGISWKVFMCSQLSFLWRFY